MPSTYNGIGTHYYGKKNLQTRAGKCRSCGRDTQLQSYDTRLWFVVVFIPIIPLGRKHIIDACPICKRHFVADLEKWETARQLEVSGAMEKFRSNPTPEDAIAAHQQMLGFHQLTEAAEFEKTMLARFPDSAKIFAYLGAAYDHLGQHEKSAEYFNRALVLRPDLPEARIGLARQHIRSGKLDDARNLLDFLEKPGAAQLYSLEPLETLGRAYQSAGRNQEALDLFGKLIEALPKVAEHAGFRKLVKKSEKALGRGETILPKQKFSFKRIFHGGQNFGRPVLNARALLVVGILVALVILGFVVSNEYIRHHRRLFLVNAYDAPATIKISGVGTIRNFKGIRPITVPEGHFHAVISGPVEQQLDFDVRDSYFNRWFGEPLWLINVGGGALIEQVTATYSQNPQPPSVTFHVGQTFQQFDTVTHPFTTLPQSVEISSGGSRTLVELQLFKGEAADVFNFYETKRNVSEALNFGERWLRAHPDDEFVLRLYASTADQAKQQKRLDAFLRAGLTNRPVQIEWHRTYQTLHDRPAEHGALVAEYDELLRAEPTNGALLYLRGRLENDRSLARDYFKRATEADPNDPYAVFALGFDHMTAGDWTAAKPLFARATELDARHSGFDNWLFISRLALGEAPALETELRQKLAREPLNYMSEFELIDALAAQNKSNDAVKASSDFNALCRSRYGAAGKMLISAVQYHAYYSVGDFEKLKSVANGDDSAAGRGALAAALIEQGEIDDAIKQLPAEMTSEEKEVFSFAIAVAYRQKGNQTAAEQWQSRGIELLQNGNGDCVHAASLLKRDAAPTRAEAESMALPPQVKTIVIASLSQQFPQSRNELADLARELNVERLFPYHLVRRVAAQAP